LNTDLTRFARSIWHLFTDVPGWSEPPLKLRIRRLIPIILPISASLLLFGWMTAVRAPQMNGVREEFAHLIALEEEIEQLGIACSDDQAEELARQAEKASEAILPSPDATEDYLQTIRIAAARHQWVGVFKDYQPADTTIDDQSIIFVPARGRMMPERSNQDPFASLLSILAEFSTSPFRIDLTRLSIRVDENTGPVAEVNFRIASHRSHEKAPQ